MDGVHLNRMPLERYKQYIRDLIKPADDVFSNDVDIDSPVLSQTERKKNCVNGEKCLSEDKVENMLKKIYDLMTEDKKKQDEEDKQILLCEEKIGAAIEVTDKISTRFASLQISTAKIKEEMDALSNSQRRNILIIKKLEKDEELKLPEKDMRARSTIIKNLLVEQLKKLPEANQKNFIIKSIFVIRSPEFPNQFQDIRVFCLTPSDATEIRNRILKAKVDKVSPWTNIEIQNDPVRATRVRIYLLQAIARKMRPKHDGDVIVSKYSDAPNLILKKDGGTTGQYSYVQAIIKFGHMLSTDDTERAQNTAGPVYNCSLKDYFLILDDKNLPDQVPTPRPSSVSDAPKDPAPSSFASAVKRKHKEDMDNYKKTKRNK